MSTQTPIDVTPQKKEMGTTVTKETDILDQQEVEYSNNKDYGFNYNFSQKNYNLQLDKIYPPLNKKDISSSGATLYDRHKRQKLK